MPSLTPPIICGFTEANTLAKRNKNTELPYHRQLAFVPHACVLSLSLSLSRKTTLTRHVRRLKITFNLWLQRFFFSFSVMLLLLYKINIFEKKPQQERKIKLQIFPPPPPFFAFIFFSLTRFLSFFATFRVACSGDSNNKINSWLVIV